MRNRSQTVEKSIKLNFCGLKLTVHNPKHKLAKIRKKYSLLLEQKTEIKRQNRFDVKSLNSAKKLILFLVPGNIKINGGVMSIYTLCETTRCLNPDATCILATYPNSTTTYAQNDMFLNNENIYRFSQITENCKNLENAIIHIPEYSVIEFCKALRKKDTAFLKSIKNLQFNILNQNIELMPPKEAITGLYKYTDNITQTVAHQRYATQEVCNKWQIPTHLFGTYKNFNKYPKYEFQNKEKIIVLSPDNNEHKTQIINKISKELSDFQLVTVENLKFSEYLDLVAKSFFVITFGEGMDGYFSHPAFVGSIGFSVYNDRFFPNDEWQNLKNVYLSYENMEQNICDDIKALYNCKTLYYETVANHLNLRTKQNLDDYDGYINNLKNFYEKNYDFVPKTELKK